MPGSAAAVDPRVLRILAPYEADPSRLAIPDRVALLARGDGIEAIARAVDDALDEFPPCSEDWAEFDARSLLAYADTNLRLRDLQDARDARQPLVRDRDAVLAAARADGPSWHWESRGEHHHVAVLSFGPIEFSVSFLPHKEGGWCQAWGARGETHALIDHLDREARHGRRVRTGLFPMIDVALAEIDRAFLETVAPDSLRVDGIDARRNAHNLRTYASHAPDGYALEPIMAEDRTRATPAGVTGVRFVRLPVPEPEPDPCLGLPFP